MRKFAQQVAKIFQNLPNPLEWRSFYRHDLPLLVDFFEEVREASMQHRLNRSQTWSLAKLKDASEKEIGVGSIRTVKTMGTSRSVPAHYPPATHH